MVLSAEVKVFMEYCHSRSDIPNCADCVLHNARVHCSQSGPFRLEWFSRRLQSINLTIGVAFSNSHKDAIWAKMRVATTQVVCTLWAVTGLRCCSLGSLLTSTIFNSVDSLVFAQRLSDLWSNFHIDSLKTSPSREQVLFFTTGPLNWGAAFYNVNILLKCNIHW